MTAESSEADRLRKDLAATLDAIEYKLNLPKRAAEKVRSVRREKPGVFSALAVGTLGVVAAAVWGVTAIKRR